MKPIVWKGEASSIAFWTKKKKNGRENQSTNCPSLYSRPIIFFLQKNASCIRIESTVRTRVHQTNAFLFIPPVAIFSKTPPEEETRFRSIRNRKPCIILSTRSHNFLPTVAQLPRLMRVHAPLLRATSIEISAAQFSLWTHKAKWAGIQSVLAHANFRDCFVRRTVAGHPCRGWRPGEEKRERKKEGTVERRKRGGREEERRTGLCFVPCNCDTYGSVKGFCTPVPQLGSVTWIALLCSFLRELFLNWWPRESILLPPLENACRLRSSTSAPRDTRPI